MFRIDWPHLITKSAGERDQMAEEITHAIAGTVAAPESGATALVQLLGHKGDLMVIVFRRSFDDLGRVQLAMSQTKLFAFLTATTSYVSIVELGMYEMTAKIHRQLSEQGLTHDSDAYNAAFDE